MVITRILLLVLLQAPAEGWREEEVGEGVVWRFRHYDELYGAKQSVGVLECDPATAKLAFVEAEQGMEKTSAIAGRTKAVAAVNGGYFTKEGRPLGILKIGGKTRSAATAGRGAVGIDGKGGFHFRRLEGGSEWPEVEEALGGVPLLVAAGRVAEFEKAAHLEARHPRTAIGVTAKQRVLLVVVDGRTAEAAGMSCAELAAFLIELGCTEALNLDGGGSSTLWVRGKPEAGVASFPSDNRKYDHAGERAVANAVVVLAKDVIVAGAEEAVLTGEWTHAGGVYTGNGTARWATAIEWAGDYEIFARGPAAARYRITVGERVKEVEPGDGDGWVSLGRYALPAGQGHEVLLTGRRAGALRWVQRN